MARVLFVLTSHDRMLDGSPTGVWLEEYAVPYYALRDAGHAITVSSVAGGPVPVDPNSEAEGWREARELLADTPAFTEIDAATFDAVYLPGGHGTMFDMPDNAALHELLRAFQWADKPIATVCHAPAVFAGMYDDGGEPFVRGRALACFSDAEEHAVNGTDKVSFLLETRLRELGADPDIVEPWQPHAVRDGLLLTGQNPQSSEAVARLLLDALDGGG